VEEYTADGLWIPGGGTFSEIPATAEGRRMNMHRYRLRKITFRVAMVLLLFGFTMQFLDLLVA
jgi:hypothetical protein